MSQFRKPIGIATGALADVDGRAESCPIVVCDDGAVFGAMDGVWIEMVAVPGTWRASAQELEAMRAAKERGETSQPV